MLRYYTQKAFLFIAASLLIAALRTKPHPAPFFPTLKPTYSTQDASTTALAPDAFAC